MREEVINVTNYVCVSLTQLAEKLKTKSKELEPFPKEVGLSLHVNYRMTSQPWRKNTKDKVCHHISNPSASTVLQECERALSAGGVLCHGQVVSAMASKFIDDVDTNVLNVTIIQLTEPLKQDKEFFKLKFLKWYLDYCAAHGILPLIQQYKTMLKNAFNKHGKKLPAFEVLDTQK